MFFDNVGGDALEAAPVAGSCLRRRPLRRSSSCSCGALRSREHVVAGDVSDFPDVLLTLFRGENTGELVLALSP